MTSHNHLDRYVPRRSYEPNFEEALKELGFPGSHPDWQAWDRLNRRACFILFRAAVAAQATLSLIIDHYPDNEQAWVIPTIEELDQAIEKFTANGKIFILNEPTQDGVREIIKVLVPAVAHGGNILNNTAPVRVPEHLLKPVLEVRDLCDEAIRQPYVA